MTRAVDAKRGGGGSLAFIAYFMKAYPGRSLTTVALLSAAGLFEGFSVLSLLPLLERVASSVGTTPSPLSAAVDRALVAVGLEPSLASLTLVILGGITFKGVFMWLAMRQVGFTVAHVTTELRLRLIRAILAARWGYFISQPAGHFGNAISSEALRAGTAYAQACRLLAGAIQLAVYVVIVILTSWRLAIFAFLAGGLVLVALHALVRLGRRAGRDQTVLLKSLLARVTDALHGIKPIKAMAREGHFRPLLEAETRGLNTALQRQIVAVEMLRAFQEPLMALMLLGGLYAVLTTGTVPFSVLAVMAFLLYRALTYVGHLQAYYQAMLVGESAFWSLMASIREADAEAEPGTSEGQPPPPLREGIVFDHVSFGYGGEPVLRDVSVTIPAGRFTALVGPSGTGKTTLADLMLGLFHPQSGEIRVDGVPLADLDLRAWRGRIGYVPQEMFLFHDTLLSNVALGDASIGREEAREALRAAGALEFVERLPEGLDTVLGEHGALLSGGQRQRVAIARALVRRPRLLILDEVTTALDPATEAGICETLRELAGTVTVVSISHQPAMVAAADVVLELGARGATMRSGRAPYRPEPIAASGGLASGGGTR